MQLPGYYFDADKNKYFKLQPGQPPKKKPRLEAPVTKRPKRKIASCKSRQDLEGSAFASTSSQQLEPILFQGENLSCLCFDDDGSLWTGGTQGSIWSAASVSSLGSLISSVAIGVPKRNGV
jgi:hypothetical protein